MSLLQTEFEEPETTTEENETGKTDTNMEATGSETAENEGAKGTNEQARKQSDAGIPRKSQRQFWRHAIRPKNNDKDTERRPNEGKANERESNENDGEAESYQGTKGRGLQKTNDAERNY